MDQDLSALLDAIVWSHRIVDVNNQIFVFRPLTLEERNIANYIYSDTKKRNEVKGIKTQDELTKTAIKRGLWKAQNLKDVEILREELTQRLEELEEEERENKKRRSPSAKLKRLRARASYLAETVETLERAYTQYVELPSSEYAAEIERGLYSLHCATLTFPNKVQKWKSYDDLKQERDTVLVSSLMRLFYDVSIAEEADIRKLARSSTWRIKWMGSKKNRGVKTLFDREMYDLSLDQFRLVYWSQIYDSAFESLETPSDEVIENDKLFDEWLDEQAEKRKQERIQAELDKRTDKSKKGSDAHEVALSVDGYYSNECNCGVKNMKNRRGHLHATSCSYGAFIYYDEETRDTKVEQVQSGNSKSVRKILANEQGRLADMGGDLVEEQVLRDNLQTRAQLGLSTNITGPGANDKGKKGRAWK